MADARPEAGHAYSPQVNGILNALWTVRVQVASERAPRRFAGFQRFYPVAPRRIKVVPCQHPDGPYSLLAESPRKGAHSRVLLRYGPVQDSPPA